MLSLIRFFLGKYPDVDRKLEERMFLNLARGIQYSFACRLPTILDKFYDVPRRKVIVFLLQKSRALWKETIYASFEVLAPPLLLLPSSPFSSTLPPLLLLHFPLRSSRKHRFRVRNRPKVHLNFRRDEQRGFNGYSYSPFYSILWRLNLGEKVEGKGTVLVSFTFFFFNSRK